MSGQPIPHRLFLSLSGVTGALFAALSDIVQKDRASAIVTLSEKAQQHLALSWFSPIYTLGFVLVLGLALVFIFDPKSKPSAFYLGASVLALVMTAIPYRIPPELDARSEPGSPNATRGVWWWGGFLGVAHAYSGEPQTQQLSEVELRLVLPREANLRWARVTLLEPTSRKILGESTTRSTLLKFYQAPGKYSLRVEAEDFETVETSVALAPGRIQMEINLTKSLIPPALQRLFPAGTARVVTRQPGNESRGAALALSANNTARQIGPRHWAWTVFVEGTAEALDQVACVEYTLHPSFRQRVHRVCQRGAGRQPFALAAEGWGTFEIQIKIALKDGREERLSHHLRF